MASAAIYSAVEALRDGRRIEIRSLRADDRTELLNAVERTSQQSLYRRFLGAKRVLSEKEIQFFLNVDFVDHVALVATIELDSRTIIVGGGRYIVVRPGTAEVAFAVVDEWQGQGIGGALLRHLIALANDAGLKELVAEVLLENGPMLRLFEKSELNCTIKRQRSVAHVTLQLSGSPEHLRHKASD
jgi:GNAT superfamily N-acetyltransferase